MKATPKFTAFLAGLLMAAVPVMAAALPAIPLTLPDGTESSIGDSTLAGVPEAKASAAAHGETHEYAGVSLLAALKAAGLKTAENLRGPALRLVVVATAADGYVVTFSLAELDPTIGAKQVLLVHSVDGSPLPESTGPWRLVVPGDSRPARWVRALQRISIRDLH